MCISIDSLCHQGFSFSLSPLNNRWLQTQNCEECCWRCSESAWVCRWRGGTCSYLVSNISYPAARYDAVANHLDETRNFWGGPFSQGSEELDECLHKIVIDESIATVTSTLADALKVNEQAVLSGQYVAFYLWGCWCCGSRDVVRKWNGCWAFWISPCDRLAVRVTRWIICWYLIWLVQDVFEDGESADLPENIAALKAYRNVDDQCINRLACIFDVLRILTTCDFETSQSSHVSTCLPWIQKIPVDVRLLARKLFWVPLLGFTKLQKLSQRDLQR